MFEKTVFGAPHSFKNNITTTALAERGELSFSFNHPNFGDCAFPLEKFDQFSLLAT